MNAKTTSVDANEVIADSEDDLEGMESFSAAQNHSISSVSAFTTINHNPQKIMSSISNFNTSRFDDGISAEPSSIADRAKMRQRTKPAPALNGDLIELTSDDEEVSSVVTDATLTGQSKAKAKPKPKLKTKEKDLPLALMPADQSVAVANEEPRRPRPRPRPKPIVKRNRTMLDSDPLPPHPYPFARDALPGANIHFTPSSSHQHGPEIPIATSPIKPMTSQLPPSDPPYPTMTTEREDEAPQPLPPIEILHDMNSDREGGKRASSPSSLFSHRSSKKRRRHGVDMDNEHEVDQLVSSSPARPGLVRTPDAPLLGAYTHPYGQEDHAMPPTFFAGSSSSAGRNEKPPEDLVPPPQPDVVDLTNLPLTIDVSVCDTNSNSKRLSKPKKARKSKAQPDPLRYDFDSQLPMEAFGNDELDSDFEPAGQPASKKSAKGKKKSAKVKKAPPKKRKEQLDAVVLTSRKKTKGKGKDDTEEVFKSKEFVEDSDDDDPLRLVGGTDVEPTSVAVSRRNLKSCALLSPSTPTPNLKPATTKPASSKHTSSSTKGTNQKNKKRKSVVDTDDEVAEQGTEADEGDSIAVKRRRKATVSLLSDEDEAMPSPQDEEGKKSSEKQCADDKKRRTDTGRRKPNQQEKKVSQPIASKNGGDGGVKEGTNTDQHDEAALEEQETQVPEKENVVPTPAPVPVPKPALSIVKPSRSRASSINAGSTTPLYARYEVAPRRSSLPMSELIRRASSKPSSPFPPPPSKKKITTNDLDDTNSPCPSTPLSSVMAYSPYLKSSRRALSRIAPLHPNRKTPPPPPPPPPPKKKTKKELEREDKWEEELVESVGGIEAWAAMNEADRKEMRRAKRELELRGYED